MDNTVKGYYDLIGVIDKNLVIEIKIQKPL